MLLNEFEDASEKGLNYVKYDLSIDSTVRGDYVDFLEGKDNTKPVKLKKADTGKYYLQPGTYVVKIEVNGTVESKKLEVKAPKKKKRGEKG